MCCMLSEISAEEHDFAPCVVSVDMFAGEHTETTREVKHLNLQPGHCVGPKVTAKAQVTDVRFAKLGKDGARKAGTCQGRPGSEARARSSP